MSKARQPSLQMGVTKIIIGHMDTENHLLSHNLTSFAVPLFMVVNDVVHVQIDNKHFVEINWDAKYLS